QVIGTTKIIDNGPDSERLNLVILAEGYRDTEQTTFNTNCDAIVTAIQNEPWFGDLINAINIHRVNVESNDSGADDPDCSGSGAGITADTYFDATFCGDGVIRRLLVSDRTKAEDVLDAQLPEWHAGVVLVNTATRGGAGGTIATASVHGGDWVDVILHELGHSLFGLADEYDYWAGCGTDTDRDAAPGGEPTEPNVTANSGISGLKWAHLVDTLTTPIPTMENPDCTTCDGRANVLGDDSIIGLYEGAKYYHCGRYRPAYDCKMRNTTSAGNPFCRVCAEAVHDLVRPFFGSDPELAADVTELDFGSIGTGASRTQDFDINNLGVVDVTGISITIDNANYSFVINPAGTTLASAATAVVSVTLGPVITVGSQNGTLTISSNDDDIIINLVGTICSASPALEVLPPHGSTLDFGDVTQGLTMYRSIEIRNNKAGCPGPLRVVLDPPTGNFTYAPGTVLDFILPAAGVAEDYTSQIVYVSFTASTSTIGAETGSLIVLTPDNPPIAPVIIDLQGNVIPEVTVDTVLVIDRSGSMQDPTGEASNRKIDHAIYAGDLYADLMKENDKAAVVRFNTSANELIGLTTAGPLETGTGRNDVKDSIDISNLNPSGGTSVGAGIIKASDILDSSTADAKAIIVLTDARENSNPSIATANTTVSGKSPQQRVFAVGLGLNQLESNLELMASLTNGYTMITPDLAGSKEFLLQKMYVQIISDVNDAAFIKDPYRILYQGQKQFTEIQISELETSVDFIVCYRPTSIFPKYTKIWLEAPDGTILDKDDATTHPNLSATQQKAHLIFRLSLPAFPAKPQAHLGTWKVWVKNFSKHRGDDVSNEIESNRYAFVYSVMSKAKSNFLLKGSLYQKDFLPNTPFEFVLDPSMHGLPVELDQDPVISIQRPDGVVRDAVLYLDADGVYKGSFGDTHQPGVYAAQTEVWATSPMGHKCSRYKYFTGVITRKAQNTPRGQDDGSGEEMRRCCKELQKLLVTLTKKSGKDVAKAKIKK
ncbi:M64 family metallo-endopeptidase, partial [Draconibacterium sp.]|nr:M64 family metallo-endopeptidase [Draconibacterium sp.]